MPNDPSGFGASPRLRQFLVFSASVWLGEWRAHSLILRTTRRHSISLQGRLPFSYLQKRYALVSSGHSPYWSRVRIIGYALGFYRTSCRGMMNADKCSTSSTPIVLFKSGWLSGEKILRIVLLASALAKRTIQIFFPHTARYRTASRASLERSGDPCFFGCGGGWERKRGRKGQRAASSLGELGVFGG